MKRFIGGFLLLLSAGLAFAQIENPVRWEISAEQDRIIFTAAIQDGWHIYDLQEQPFGPNPTVFTFENIRGAQLAGAVFTDALLIIAYDKFFGMETGRFKGRASFIQKMKLIGADDFSAEGYIDYTACHEKRCITLKEEFSLPHAVKAAAAATAAPPADLWRPVIDELNSFAPQAAAKTSWLGIFLISFGGGLLALLMPCIWPIIPLTVSVFLKRSQNNFKKAAADAALYGLSIIIIYLAFGLVFTLIFGASALNSLATNAAANLIFFALLLVFAVSFFGVFEMRMPSAWVNKISGKAQSATGVLSIFFMAFTLVLVSFSCTAPIVGTLLVQIATMNAIAAPVIGMLGFASALAIPFTAFAFFPSLIKKMPKSGEWLNTTKVALGFLELALALKFLSVVDLAYHWGILNREVFLILWIIIFTLLGFYILRKSKLPGLIFAVIIFTFAGYMVPGLWGAPLKSISAFLPPLSTQKFNLYKQHVQPKFLDYDEGMAYARANNKPVMLDFTGYGCVNCRKMEAAVLSDPRVKEIIDNDFVLISLHVDDKTALPQIIEVEENGKIIKLRTVGDKWSRLQRHKFGANAQPFYVLLDTAAIPIAPWYAYDENINNFINFLKTGLRRFTDGPTPRY